MSFLDEQIDAMMLDPTSDKEFLGNTYKWWASLLNAEEIVNSLSQKSLPIFLVHGVKDNKIPISSADLAVEALKESGILTYLRLEGYGHDLDTTEVHEAACHWLASILFGQAPLDGYLIIKATNSAPALLENEQVNMSDYVFTRGRDKDSGDRGGGKGEAYVGGGASRDSDGNERAWAEGGVEYRSDNWRGDISAGGSSSRDSNGNTKNEAHVEARGTLEF